MAEAILRINPHNILECYKLNRIQSWINSLTNDMEVFKATKEDRIVTYKPVYVKLEQQMEFLLNKQLVI